MPRSARIAVLGAGPIGLEAALYARRLGLTVRVYERDEVGEHLLRWGHVRMFTPFAMNHTPLGVEVIRREHPQHRLPAPQTFLTGSEHRDAYLLPLSLTTELCESIQMKTEILHIGRAGLHRTDASNDPRRAASAFRLLLRDEQRRERVDEADVILDCSGTYGRHGWLGDGGIPAIGERAAEPHIAYGLEDILGNRKSHYAGRSVIVVGSGYSAATAVCELATLAEQHPSTWVIWLTRGPRSTPLSRLPGDTLRERDRLAARANSLATRGDGNVEHHGQTVIESVESHGANNGFRVAARCAGRAVSWEVERLIAHVGNRLDSQMSAELHLSESSGVRQPEPNYFVLGMKSAGRAGSFLLSEGFEQVHDVFAQFLKIPGPNLYAPRAA